ncbi:GNAT family N-acetyltransferase [Erwinia sp. MMLR14_017]|uniref:GNAT family N-acetyltransferase n=1 Tax=Erwinia sp. MMLR14_017 TaxID=3093842 RepID=UPI00298F8899|nr:GNAT family N-acetyltransferase [Erwinia sp. MMLR14_017]MDW8845059.1 GNAT family N-acetyltransferase [Erwinia sp. MMLR14_017]
MKKVFIEQWHEKYRQDFVSLSLEWLEKYVSVEPVDLEILNDPEGYILSRGGAVFFARLDGETVGTVAMIPGEDDAFELAKLAVTEKYKGLRIGQLLMERCIAFAEERKAKKIFLFTTDVLVAAVNLYRRNGFTDVDLTENKYVEADMRMELILHS